MLTPNEKTDVYKRQQQVLVLFVQVRILVVQRRKALKENIFRGFFFFLWMQSHFLSH